MVAEHNSETQPTEIDGLICAYLLDGGDRCVGGGRIHLPEKIAMDMTFEGVLALTCAKWLP